MTALFVVVFDLFSYFLAILPVVFSWSISIYLYYRCFLVIDNIFYKLPLLAVFPIALILFYCICIFILRVSLPKLRPGIYRVNRDKMVYIWLAHLSLNRSQKVSGFLYMIRGVNFFKYLVYKSLGAKISYNVKTAMEFVLVDIPLISVGPGSFFGEGVHISCHYFQNDRLYLKEVNIGKNVFIGMNSVVGPGSQIGDNSWIGYGNIVKGYKVDPNSKILDLEWERGRTQCKESVPD